MKTSIENKVLIGFTGTFLVLFITGWLLYKNNRNAEGANHLVAHTSEVLYKVSELQGLITGLETGVRGAVLSENIHYTAVNDSKVAEIVAVLQQLKNLTRDNALQQKQLDTVAALAALKIQTTHQALSALATSGFKKARTLVASAEGERLMKQADHKLLEVKFREKQLFALREKAYAAKTLRAQWLFILLLIIFTLIMLSMYVVLRNNLSARARNERKITRLNHALEHHVAQLELVNKDLESFSYSVSHDLRSPLRAINGYTLILANDYDDKFDDEARRLMSIVINNSKKMGQLIDDLLAFSRLGRKDIVPHHVVMNQLVSDVVEELKIHSRAKDVELEIEDLPGAYGDTGMLKQVWTNLISNAIKYSKAGVKPVIRINSYREKNRSVYCIADNGVGFDMSFYNKLFGVFQRLHNADEFEGTGVGLAIVKRIIHKHKGEIWAEAKVNAGAKFCFSIPN